MQAHTGAETFIVPCRANCLQAHVSLVGTCSTGTARSALLLTCCKCMGRLSTAHTVVPAPACACAVCFSAGGGVGLFGWHLCAMLLFRILESFTALRSSGCMQVTSRVQVQSFAY